MNQRQFDAAHDRYLNPPDEEFDDTTDDEMDLADIRRQREYQPGAGQQHWHPTYGQLRAMPVERRPSAKRNPPDRQGDRNAFEQP